jgi:hypothetical protein
VNWVVGALAVWLVLSVIVALATGRAIRHADEQEAQR